MALRAAGLLLDELLAPHVLILRVGLGQVVQAEALREVQLGDALVASAHEGIEAPLGVRGRPLAPAAEKLLVLDLQRANIALDLAQIVV